jgi:hypothetical protein
VGLAAWILEKFQRWTDCGGGAPDSALSKDEMLTDICIYWCARCASVVRARARARAFVYVPALWAPNRPRARAALDALTHAPHAADRNACARHGLGLLRLACAPAWCVQVWRAHRLVHAPVQGDAGQHVR